MTPEDLSKRITGWKRHRDRAKEAIRIEARDEVTRLNQAGREKEANILLATLGELEPDFHPTISVDHTMDQIDAVFVDGTVTEDIPLREQRMGDGSEPYNVCALLWNHEGTKIVGIRIYGVAKMWPESQYPTFPEPSPEKKAQVALFVEEMFGTKDG
ncbi:MAG TPA: hypothetical protein VJJ24_03800 [Candidatus Paceibacterota bacterium]